MNSYRCYWKQEGKLCRMDASKVEDASAAIEAVKDALTFSPAFPGGKICVLAVVK